MGRLCEKKRAVSGSTSGLALISLAFSLLLVVLSSCGGGDSGLSNGENGVPSGVEKAIKQTVALLQRAIEDEDIILGADQVGDIFTMGGLVAFRFRREGAPGQPTEESKFSVLLNDFFRDNENIRTDLIVSSIDLNGELASVEIEFHLSAAFARESPPISYFVDALDRLTFQRDQGAWKIIHWEEVEEVLAGDEEGPGDLEPIVAINRTIKDLEEIINTQSFKNEANVISALFEMDADVAARFWTSTTLSGGVPNPVFQEFMSEVFNQNENIVFSLAVIAWEIQEDVATITVQFNLVATYLPSIPPELYDAAATDQINLRHEEDGYWRIISWVEAPAEGPEASAEGICRLALLSLQETIRSEDFTLLGDSLAPGFLLHPDIAGRFFTHITALGGEPSVIFSEFMTDFFIENVNIGLELQLSDFSQNGDVATGKVGFNLNSTYILDVPPTDYTVTETGDSIQFTRFGEGDWRILIWMPGEEPNDGELIEELLLGIGEAITARTPDDLLSSFSPLFSLDQDVALRFPTHHDGEIDPPSSVFSEHIGVFLAENANATVTITPDIESLEIEGEIAHLGGATQLIVSDYILSVPATHFENEDEAIFDLVKSGGIWQVYGWLLVGAG